MSAYDWEYTTCKRCGNYNYYCICKSEDSYEKEIKDLKDKLNEVFNLLKEWKDGEYF